ncbi:hypothetical protein [Spiroplasma endosymbiont of Atherix ibis]|uniref:hypothetical protein n=1 Tax=Spiroplasma endosymbiont of Atherix ibis TaxID=3066291 RepID=UPI0030D3B111
MKKIVEIMKTILIKFNFMLLADVPNFKSISNYIWGYGLSEITVICSLISLFLIFVLIKIYFRISKLSSDGYIEGRITAIRDIIWASLLHSLQLLQQQYFCNIFKKLKDRSKKWFVGEPI